LKKRKKRAGKQRLEEVYFKKGGVEKEEKSKKIGKKRTQIKILFRGVSKKENAAIIRKRTGKNERTCRPKKRRVGKGGKPKATAGRIKTLTGGNSRRGPLEGFWGGVLGGGGVNG